MVRLDAASARPRGEVFAELLRNGRLALEAGNYLEAYDHAARAQARGFESRSLDYLSLLALANAGSTQLALKRFRALGLTENDTGEDWLALEGRLLKDLALAGEGDGAAAHLFLRSGEAYHAAFLRTGGSFTAINAATMLMLGGRSDEALRLARDVLARIQRSAPSDETDLYYRQVTEAEAALLLGDVERCRGALNRADALLHGNLNVRSRTVAQLRLICRHFGLGEDLLNALTLAPVIYLRRPDPAAADALALLETAQDASFVFAGISEPAELALAEHYRRENGRLHLVLPAPAATLIEQWRRRHGERWATRLRSCIDHADEISIASGFLDDEDRWCAAYVSSMAFGLSRLAAQRLGCRWQALELTPRGDGFQLTPLPSADAFGTELVQQLDGVEPERRAATPTAAGRRFIGTLFADFAGFSRLDDAELPQFQALFIGAIAECLARFRERILLQHTWGDAVHVVTVDAESTADIAAEIQAIVERLRPGLSGMLAKLELRLAAHYAPVYFGLDPVEDTSTFFGTQLSFTARIEPVTPPGMIFVTEAFAARLALEAPQRFVVEYAGEIDLAKRYGKYRLFSLQRVRSVTVAPR